MVWSESGPLTASACTAAAAWPPARTTSRRAGIFGAPSPGTAAPSTWASACPTTAPAATIAPAVPTPAARRKRRLVRPGSSAACPLLCRPVGMEDPPRCAPPCMNDRTQPLLRRIDKSATLPRLRLAEAAEDGDDLPQDLGVVAVDGVEGGVVREELDVPAAAEEVLDRGLGLLVGDEGGDHVAVVGRVLTADDHVVAVFQPYGDHRLSADLEHEELTLADQLTREGQQLLDHVLGQGTGTGGDRGAHQGHVGGQRPRHGGHRLLEVDLDGAGLGRVAADEALALERLELGVDAGRRGQADGLADHLQDATLPGGELLRHRCTPSRRNSLPPAEPDSSSADGTKQTPVRCRG